jgi:hypothetical protein
VVKWGEFRYKGGAGYLPLLAVLATVGYRRR